MQHLLQIDLDALGDGFAIGRIGHMEMAELAQLDVLRHRFQGGRDVLDAVCPLVRTHEAEQVAGLDVVVGGSTTANTGAGFWTGNAISARNSIFEGEDFGVRVNNVQSTVVSNQLNAPNPGSQVNGGTLRCFGTYDGSLNELDAACQPLP